MKSFKEWILEALEKGTHINTKYTYDMKTTHDLAEDISRDETFPNGNEDYEDLRAYLTFKGADPLVLKVFRTAYIEYAKASILDYDLILRLEIADNIDEILNFIFEANSYLASVDENIVSRNDLYTALNATDKISNICEELDNFDYSIYNGDKHDCEDDNYFEELDKKDDILELIESIDYNLNIYLGVFNKAYKHIENSKTKDSLKRNVIYPIEEMIDELNYLKLKKMMYDESYTTGMIIEIVDDDIFYAVLEIDEELDDIEEMCRRYKILEDLLHYKKLLKNN